MYTTYQWSKAGDGRATNTRVPNQHQAAAGQHSDAELMRELCADGGDALETLFLRFRRLVHRVAVDILRDAAEAEDVTQEVFLEIYRKAHLYDPARGSLKVWLLQYAYHRSLRRKHALRLRAAYRSEPIEHAESLGHEWRHQLTRQECRWFILAGLSQLPARQRAALELVCLEELTLRDVAERLRVSVGCARHYYYRGLARLRTWAALDPSTPQAPQEAGRRRRTAARYGTQTRAS